ncbi:YdaU family protein [Acidiphilium sp.]|uniref:YdaU family protein n=1 Tax=Acidiphilium sp. TaxID=527 RepID=UPI00258B28F9|nr:YdaU family protein [Acidiphilium sp.]
MNRYDRYPGDYLRATLTLSMAQDGAYTRLLDYYYSTEQPIPVDEAYAAARCRGPEDEAVTQWVLSRFFELTDSGYLHERASREIEKARPRIEAARANGRKGGRKKEAVNKPSGLPSGLPSAKPTANPTPKLPSPSPSQAEANQELLQDTPATQSQSESSIAEPKKANGQDKLCALVIDAYHEALPKCRKVSAMTPKRHKRISMADKLAKRICEQQGGIYDPSEFWSGYFAQCATDPWMRGEVPNPKNPAWRQNLDVLLAEDRFAAVIDSALEVQNA